MVAYRGISAEPRRTVLMQTAIDDTRLLLRLALAGHDLDLDGGAYRLHDLTQIALMLQPQASLAIRHAEYMTPLERASIASAGRGRVVFI